MREVHLFKHLIPRGAEVYMLRYDDHDSIYVETFDPIHTIKIAEIRGGRLYEIVRA